MHAPPARPAAGGDGDGAPCLWSFQLFPRQVRFGTQSPPDGGPVPPGSPAAAARRRGGPGRLTNTLMELRLNKVRPEHNRLTQRVPRPERLINSNVGVCLSFYRRPARRIGECRICFACCRRRLNRVHSRMGRIGFFLRFVGIRVVVLPQCKSAEYYFHRRQSFAVEGSIIYVTSFHKI